MKGDRLKFVEDAIGNMIEWNVSIRLEHKRSVDCGDGINVSGWFDPEPPTFVVATAVAEKKWFQIFVHEYCHVLQWRDNKLDSNNVDFWEWVQGQEVPKENAKQSMIITRECEIDCERRAFNLIRNWETLLINLDNYVQKANAYIFIYTVAFREKKWKANNKPAPYNVPAIVNIMPTKFLNNFDRVPKEYSRLVKELCF